MTHFTEKRYIYQQALSVDWSILFGIWLVLIDLRFCRVIALIWVHNSDLYAGVVVSNTYEGAANGGRSACQWYDDSVGNLLTTMNTDETVDSETVVCWLTQSYITWYCIGHYINWSRLWIKVWTCKIQPIDCVITQDHLVLFLSRYNSMDSRHP